MIGESGPIDLPRTSDSGVPLERAIRGRRSVRGFSSEPISLDQLSLILWSAQGITGPERGLRAVPSAGATFPLELFIVVKRGGVEGLKEGVYRYISDKHALEPLLEDDVSPALAQAALGQGFVERAPVNVIIAAEHGRTARVYGQRGVRYVHMEAGHAGQNIALEAEALGLGTVMVGAFEDMLVKKVVGMPAELEPLYIIPLGQPRS